MSSLSPKTPKPQNPSLFNFDGCCSKRSIRELELVVLGHLGGSFFLLVRLLLAVFILEFIFFVGLFLYLLFAFNFLAARSTLSLALCSLVEVTLRIICLFFFYRV